MTFQILPALDLLSGRAVKLRGVQPGTETDYGEPLPWLREWEAQGARRAMVFDLDVYFGTGDNSKTIHGVLAALSPRTSVLLGARSEEWFDAGPRVLILLGGPAARDPERVKAVSRRVGKERLFLALNHGPGARVEEVVSRANELGPLASAVVVTDLTRDATGAGLDMDLFRALCREVRRPLIAAGGLARKEEIRELKAMGAAGVVVGRALFERRYTLRELLREAGR